MMVDGPLQWRRSGGDQRACLFGGGAATTLAVRKLDAVSPSSTAVAALSNRNPAQPNPWAAQRPPSRTCPPLDGLTSLQQRGGGSTVQPRSAPNTNFDHCGGRAGGAISSQRPKKKVNQSLVLDAAETRLGVSACRGKIKGRRFRGGQKIPIIRATCSGRPPGGASLEARPLGARPPPAAASPPRHHALSSMRPPPPPSPLHTQTATPPRYSHPHPNTRNLQAERDAGEIRERPFSLSHVCLSEPSQKTPARAPGPPPSPNSTRRGHSIRRIQPPRAHHVPQGTRLRSSATDSEEEEGLPLSFSSTSKDLRLPDRGGDGPACESRARA